MLSFNPDPPPPVEEVVTDSPTPEDFEAEPFPKDSVALKLPEQTELSIQVVDRKIRLNEDGEIIYSSLEEFKSLPYHLQHRVVYERGIRLFLYTTEDRYEMLAKYGTAERLYKFLKERARQLFLARYGFFVDEPNKYEIKDEN